MSDEQDRSKPLSISEILQEQKQKPVVKDKIRPTLAIPIGVGDTGLSMGRMRRYYSDEDSCPDGETVGARIKD